MDRYKEDIHTMKGLSRVLGFLNIANQFHLLEDHIKDLNVEMIANQVHELKILIDEFFDIYNDLFASSAGISETVKSDIF